MTNKSNFIDLLQNKSMN